MRRHKLSMKACRNDKIKQQGWYRITGIKTHRTIKSPGRWRSSALHDRNPRPRILRLNSHQEISNEHQGHLLQRHLPRGTFEQRLHDKQETPSTRVKANKQLQHSLQRQRKRTTILNRCSLSHSLRFCLHLSPLHLSPERRIIPSLLFT